MRHRVSGRKLSRHTKHRELMFRNMLVSLFQHQRVRTTLAKGKELRSLADKLISLAKKNTLHARRLAFARLRNETIVKKLFDEIAPKMKDREGGYSRIYKIGWRHGDGAPLSLVELVSYSPPEEKKSTVEKAKKVLEKVAPKKKEKKAETKEKGKKAKQEKAPKEKNEKAKEKASKEK